jgi:hypothetical protein
MSDAAPSDLPDNDDTIVMSSVSPHQRLDPDGPPPFAPEPQPAQPAQPAPAHELSSEQQMRMNALTFALLSRFLTTEIGEQLRSGETTVDTAIRLLRAWSPGPGPGPDADGG